MKRTIERDTTGRKFHKLMKKNGWVIDRTCKSDHVIYRKGDQKVLLKSTDVNCMIQRRLIKELNLK